MTDCKLFNMNTLFLGGFRGGRGGGGFRGGRGVVVSEVAGRKNLK